MATVKTPDLNVSPRSGSTPAGGELPSGRATSAPEPRSASGTGSSGRRDFYREALERSRREQGSGGRAFPEDTRPLERHDAAGAFPEALRSYDHREDARGGGAGNGYGAQGAYAWGRQMEEAQGRRDAELHLPASRSAGVRTHQGLWAEEREVDRVQEWRGRAQHEEERQGHGHHTGRKVAMAALGTAAGVGVGLMRRSGRWHKEPLCAGEIMTRGVRTVLPDQSVWEVARLMREENVGIVPVTDTSGRLLGVVTDRDLVMRTTAEDRLPSKVRVADVMSADDLEVVTADDSVHQVIFLMGKNQVRRIPVVARDNRLLGIIAMADIANRAEEDDELQEALERISARRSFWTRQG